MDKISILPQTLEKIPARKSFNVSFIGKILKLHVEICFICEPFWHTKNVPASQLHAPMQENEIPELNTVSKDHPKTSNLDTQDTKLIMDTGSTKHCTAQCGHLVAAPQVTSVLDTGAAHHYVSAMYLASIKTN